MHTIVALVGRPNVGKSTLFNQLTRSREALVANFAGLTRDRQYGMGQLGGHYWVIDTGGLTIESDELEQRMGDQTRQGIAEADVVLWLLDAREGLTPSDQSIAEELRRIGKPVYLVANKTDGLDKEQALADFYALGMGTPYPIAAVHGRGLQKMMAEVLEDFAGDDLDSSEADTESPSEHGIRLAFIGRPNVGKSTLVNRILGEQRVVVSDVPGTTRDSIFIPFERDQQRYTLIDTAGVRRRAKVKQTVEKFSVVKTLAAIDQADVVIHVLDCRESITDQDVHLIGLSLDAGRPIVVALNKWDNLPEETRDQVRQDYQRKLVFLDFAQHFTISALHGTGVGLLFDAVQKAWRSSRLEVSTANATRLLEEAVYRHQPPMVQGRRIKLRYAHQGGKNPPIFVIHGNQTNRVPGAYKRYLENFFRQRLKMVGTPIRLEFKTGDNPYANKRKKPQSHKRDSAGRPVRKTFPKAG